MDKGNISIFKLSYLREQGFDQFITLYFTFYSINFLLISFINLSIVYCLNTVVTRKDALTTVANLGMTSTSSLTKLSVKPVKVQKIYFLLLMPFVMEFRKFWRVQKTEIIWDMTSKTTIQINLWPQDTKKLVNMIFSFLYRHSLSQNPIKLKALHHFLHMKYVFVLNTWSWFKG